MWEANLQRLFLIFDQTGKLITGANERCSGSPLLALCHQ